MTKYIDREKLAQMIKASPIFNSFGEDGLFIKEFVWQLIQRQPAINLDELIADAITEFAEMLKKYYSNLKGFTYASLAAYHIDQIAKEMISTPMRERNENEKAD